MSDHWVSADRVFDGYRFHDDHAIGVTSGVVDTLEATREVAGPIARHYDGILAPGFFDIQVNGGGGVLLNTSPTAEGVGAIAAAHRAFGTVALMPTVITDAPDVLSRAVEAVIEARDVPGVMGLHIEGPHISEARRGTHAARYVRPMEPATLAHVERLRAEGLLALVTVAPEAAGDDDIEDLVRAGATVSLGHSDVDVVTAEKALSAGATGVTHLFNAMSPMTSRSPGLTGAAIASEAWCSIIADGHHVDPLMVSLAVRARPAPDRMIAVSDAMATVGGPDHFTLYDQEIALESGRLVNAEAVLAGAHLTMAEAARNLVAFGVSMGDALRMCRHNPAQFLGVEETFGLVGAPVSDVLHLDVTLGLRSTGLDA